MRSGFAQNKEDEARNGVFDCVHVCAFFRENERVFEHWPWLAVDGRPIPPVIKSGD